MSPWSFFLLLFFELNNWHKETFFKKESPKCKKIEREGKNEGGN